MTTNTTNTTNTISTPTTYSCISNNCPYFQSIANTDTTGQGLCGFFNDYSPVDGTQPCPLLPKPLMCADCDRYGNDYGCATAEADDPVNYEHADGVIRPCPGFVDKCEVELEGLLLLWKRRGVDYNKKIISAVNTINNIKLPWEIVNTNATQEEK